MLAEPAVLMSAPKIRIKLGISSSPPATPRRLLTDPTPMPIAAPAAMCATAFDGNRSLG